MSPLRFLALPLLALLLLLSLPAPGQAQEGGGGEHLALTLDDAIRLALQNNRGLLDAQLQRTVRAFSLEVAEDRYRPTASLGSTLRGQKDQDWTTDVVAETGLRVDTGGRFSLRWSKPLAGRDESAGTLSLGSPSPATISQSTSGTERPGTSITIPARRRRRAGRTRTSTNGASPSSPDGRPRSRPTTAY